MALSSTVPFAYVHAYIPPVPSLSIPALSGDAIKDNLLFQEVPMAALELVIDSMASITVPADTDIIKQV